MYKLLLIWIIMVINNLIIIALLNPVILATKPHWGDSKFYKPILILSILLAILFNYYGIITTVVDAFQHSLLIVENDYMRTYEHTPIIFKIILQPLIFINNSSQFAKNWIIQFIPNRFGQLLSNIPDILACWTFLVCLFCLTELNFKKIYKHANKGAVLLVLLSYPYMLLLIDAYLFIYILICILLLKKLLQGLNFYDPKCEIRLYIIYVVWISVYGIYLILCLLPNDWSDLYDVTISTYFWSFTGTHTVVITSILNELIGIYGHCYVYSFEIHSNNPIYWAFIFFFQHFYSLHEYFIDCYLELFRLLLRSEIMNMFFSPLRIMPALAFLLAFFFAYIIISYKPSQKRLEYRLCLVFFSSFIMVQIALTSFMVFVHINLLQIIITIFYLWRFIKKKINKK